MNYNDYQRSCRATAIYPSYAQIVYPTISLIDEIGETEEKMTAVIPPASEEIVKELGDVMWEVAILAGDCRIQLTDVVTHAQDYNTVSLFIPAARVAGLVGKSIRDNNSKISPDAQAAIMLNLAQVVAAVTFYAGYYYSSLEEVCAKNLAKLRDRAARGVISGSGDNR